MHAGGTPGDTMVVMTALPAEPIPFYRLDRLAHGS
jgi:hypothetical protein